MNGFFNANWVKNRMVGKEVVLTKDYTPLGIYKGMRFIVTDVFDSGNFEVLDTASNTKYSISANNLEW